jgi:hypothetical protein
MEVQGSTARARARARGWCTEASSRGEAKQPRRCAGRRAGAHRRGAKEPRQESSPDPLAVNAERLWSRLGETGSWQFI